ncbi:hypothetical protein PUR61_03955 [Streptomyces sp. BE20]|uniref:hypothetical protein n=1 Tax=unclassified Streptomyces TaxID=2593676 RepID=UPI002E7A0C66|nr:MULTISPECIES: hypothetical protein [unclassified Streptomyces]MED7953700.1 hypothetical protein [Streptomyces sp. BE303]MEE1821354.1 hypothetical protein [Streptomyces sp. BE20]
MICPHCAKSLRQRERGGHRCSYCRKDFALDPKSEGTGLNDLRIRKLTAKLTLDGRLACTVGQLRYALQRRGRPEPSFLGSRGGGSCLGVLGIAAMVVGLALNGSLTVLLALGGMVLIGTGVRQFWLADTPAPPAPVELRWDADDFRRTVVDRWKKVYGTLPSGLVEDDLVRPGPPPAEPAFVLLCPDRTVTTFLQANDYPRRHRALLVTDLRAVPAGLPVVVLHDASPQGCLLVADARAALRGRRVLDAGLPVRTVLVDQDKFVLLRDPHRSEELQARLERTVPGLTGGERAWFAEGWWSPLAALPPKRLLAVAVRAAERAGGRGTAGGPAGIPAPRRPDRPENPIETRRRALAVGFLTWPEEQPGHGPGPTRKGTA